MEVSRAIKFFLSLCFSFVFGAMSLPASAGNTIADSGAAAGAEVMIRQVLTKKLLAKSFSTFNRDLKIAIEGSKDGRTSVNIQSIICEPAVGSLDCSLHFLSMESDGTADKLESNFDLVLKIQQGQVISAKVSNIAG